MIPLAHQLLILTYAVLGGVSLLVPVPYLDDWLRNLLNRRMVRELAKLNGLELSPAEVKLLTQAGDGCLAELMQGLFLGPLKRVVREVVFVLEWRRAVNMVSKIYYEGFLLDYLFTHKAYRPGDLIYAARVRRAILFARQRANTKVVAQAVKISFSNSRELIRPVVRLIYHFLGQGVINGSDGLYQGVRRLAIRVVWPSFAKRALRKTRERLVRENLTTELGIEKLKANAQVGELVGVFARQFASIPQEHFEGMCRVMLAELGLRKVRRTPPVSPPTSDPPPPWPSP